MSSNFTKWVDDIGYRYWYRSTIEVSGQVWMRLAQGRRYWHEERNAYAQQW